MQSTVELVRAGSAGERQVAAVVRVPALGARPVSGRERGCVVEEEKSRVTPWGHRPACSVTAPELQPARDPALHLPLPADDAVLVVQAAAVAVDEPALGRVN